MAFAGTFTTTGPATGVPPTVLNVNRSAPESVVRPRAETFTVSTAPGCAVTATFPANFKSWLMEPPALKKITFAPSGAKLSGASGLNAPAPTFEAHEVVFAEVNPPSPSTCASNEPLAKTTVCAARSGSARRRSAMSLSIIEEWAHARLRLETSKPSPPSSRASDPGSGTSATLPLPNPAFVGGGAKLIPSPNVTSTPSAMFSAARVWLA